MEYRLPIPGNMRVRFNLRPVAAEWAVQPFVPKMPYLLGTWIPGTILTKNLIEFERKQVWFDPTVGQYPDVLVYDKNYQIKYALDGMPPNLKRPPDKGWLFLWRTSQILDMDALHARVQVNVDLAPDDTAFGFYSYLEPDVLFMSLDVNPFSNPALKGKENGRSGFRTVSAKKWGSAGGIPTRGPLPPHARDGPPHKSG